MDNGQSKELTTTNTALQTGADDFAVPGMEDFGRADMVVPRLRLVQAQSGFSQDAGKYHNNMSSLAKEALEILVIGARKGRVRWPEKYQRDQEPLCASDDGKEARAEMAGVDATGTPTQDCTRCIYSQWSTENGTQRIPPPCSPVITFLVVDIEDDLPSLISFKRTSAAAGRQLVTLVKSFGLRRTYWLTSELEEGATGKYYVSKVAMGSPMVPERLRHYVELAEQFREQTITTDTESDTQRPATERQDQPPDDDERIPF